MSDDKIQGSGSNVDPAPVHREVIAIDDLIPFAKPVDAAFFSTMVRKSMKYWGSKQLGSLANHEGMRRAIALIQAIVTEKVEVDSSR
jgi:hypothetical protein